MEVFEAGRTSLPAYLAEVWKYRHLVLTFAKRDLKVKYAQTTLGIAWAMLQPLTGLLIFTLFFDKVLQVDTAGVPYPLFALTGMSSWYYFTYIFGSAGTSLLDSQSIIKKVYFPKLILPLSKIFLGGADFLCTIVLLAIAMLLYGRYPGMSVIFFPFFLIFNIVVALSNAIWLSALTVRNRDAHHIIPYLINFSIWITPVFYPTTILPASLSSLMYINPMAFVIEGYRYSLLGSPPPSPYYLISVVPVIILLFTGLLYFLKVEDDIVDKI